MLFTHKDFFENLYLCVYISNAINYVDICLEAMRNFLYIYLLTRGLINTLSVAHIVEKYLEGGSNILIRGNIPKFLLGD
jgi:hypothetical protein